ncbi:MAG: AMP-binding protein, partial [Paracoccaceae bacterium]
MVVLSALLIGNESLTQACGAAWLARGHRLAAVVTRHAEVRAWALTQGVRVEAPGPGLTERLGAQPAGLSCDWLLSVANLSLVPAAVRGLARRGAVNFHDGPLPRYAGLNAPVWALLAEEAQHGITWHLMTDGVDKGDILEQRLFDIAPGETALSLNTRCFDAGVESFPAVMAQLEGGLHPVAQDFAQRRVFARADRPAAFGRLDFAAPADAVAQRVRALDHGRYWNPLTTAKIAGSFGVLNVGAADVVPGQAVPGTVLAAAPEGVVVACGSGAVRLHRLTCQARGLPVCPSTVRDVAMLADADPLTAALAALVPFEAGVRKRLAAMSPAMVSGAGDGAGWLRLAVAGDAATLAVAMARVSGQDSSDVALSIAPGLAGYSSGWVPVRVATDGTVGATKAVLRAERAPGFALDLMTRDVALADLVVPQVGVSLHGAPVPGTVVTLCDGAVLADLSRISAEQARALAARLEFVAGVAVDDGLVSALPMMSPRERHAVVHDVNQTRAARDAYCVHQAFEAQVRRTPDAPAISFESVTLTYAALNARANRVAHVLRGMGVGPGVLVGLHLRRSLEMLVGALAIQKAGGAYVPMDPAYPPDRTALYIEDSRCPVIVTTSDLAGGLPGRAVALCLDTDGRIPSASDINPECGVGPGDLAYMIYTSGSTGRPKGVMVEHRNIVNFFNGMDQRIGTQPGVWLAVTSLSFDISVLELFWTLARGFKVVISSDENRALMSSGR